MRATPLTSEHGFDVKAGIVDGFGYERTPEIAAAIFAQSCDAMPKTPAQRARIKPDSVPTAQLASAGPADLDGDGAVGQTTWPSCRATGARAGDAFGGMRDESQSLERPQSPAVLGQVAVGWASRLC